MSQRKIWPRLTEEQKQFILDNFKGCSQDNMAAKLNASVAEVKKFYRDNHLDSGLTGRFQKGSTPWTKGKTPEQICKTPEALERSKATRFGKGHRPHNRVPVGTEVVKYDGYLWRKIAEPNKWEQKHRLIYEEAYGVELREEDVVMFLDGNRMNLDLNNLQLITRSENSFLTIKKLRHLDIESTKAAITVARLNTAINKRKKTSV